MTSMAPVPTLGIQDGNANTLVLTTQLMVRSFIRRTGLGLAECAVQSKLKPAKIFKKAVEPAPPPSPSAYTSRSNHVPDTRQITGISFDDRGDHLITAAEDETFRLYHCKTGKQVHLASQWRATTDSI